MICRIGKGLTAESRFFVRKSQKILGQKKAPRAAPTWSDVGVSSEDGLIRDGREDLGLTCSSSQND